MITVNYLRYLLRRPERGFDPVPEEYAQRNSRHEWAKFMQGEYNGLIDWLEKLNGGFRGKTVLDLGGGPGQFCAAFARRGASVTWHDISARYQKIAEKETAARGLSVKYSIGYLEDAEKFTGAGFDFVFNRICWMYCSDDRSFARLVFRLVKPGGAGYVDSHHLPVQGMRPRIDYALNRYLYIKNSYVPPPRGRIIRLLGKYPVERPMVDASTEENDRLFFRRLR
jgi:SAM-dependent methyltransferase